MATRDDFSAPTKRLLSERVGFRCSNPKCRRHTSGPSADPSSSVNIGVAAHITAAAPGGPRYDSSLSSDERKDQANGIWLCQICAKLIDDDSDLHTIDLLYEWKNQAEIQAAKSLLNTPELSASSEGQHSIVISAILSNQVEYLAAKLANTTDQELPEMRTAWREGRRDEAANWLQAQKSDTHTWAILPVENRADLLCFEASLDLDIGNLDRAKQLLAEAQKLASPKSAGRLQALITFHEKGPKAAQQTLVDYDDIDSINLRGALLLEDGQVSSCLSLLSTADGNPEMLRIRALAHLASKELVKAQLDIQKAHELSPNWVSIRYARAVIDYFSTLSPAALPDRLVAWPKPVDWMLMKRDSESKKRLQEATKEFDALATDEIENAGEQQRLRIWSLACQVSDTNNQEEAADYCRSILRENPASYPAITWALAHQYEIDLQQSRIALEKCIEKEPENVSHHLGLILCHYRLQHFDDALQVLTSVEALFRDSDQLSVWLFWRIRVLSATGNREGVEQLILELGNDANLPEVRGALLFAALEAGDWSSVANYHMSVYQDSGDPIALLNYCEALAHQNQWSAIADWVDALVERIRTADVLQFVGIAAYNAHRYDLCLRLLDDNREFFENGRLPPNLRRIRIAAQQALGLIPSAISEAERLWQEERNIDDLSRLISLYFWVGDLKGAAVAARELRNTAAVTTEQLLQAVHFVLHEEPGLAIDLWRRAFRQGIPDLLVGDAVFSGFQLKMDNAEEMRALSQRMSELGRREEAGIFMKEASDLIPFLREQAEHHQRLEDAYLEAKAPVHLTNWPLPQLYHINLTKNAQLSNPLRQIVLLARHGGKQLEEGFPGLAPQWRLNIDITAFLLAAHFDILDAVEGAYAPLRIPTDLIQALVKMREELIPHQPARLQLHQEVLRFVEADRIHVVDNTKLLDTADGQLTEELGMEWIALYEMATRGEGFLVDYLPLRKRDLSGPISGLSEDVEERVVNTKALLEAMRKDGHISENNYEVALANLGAEGQAPASRIVPFVGADLYFVGNTIESLADGNVLHIAAEHFQIHLEKRYVERIRADFNALDDWNEAVVWLDGLLNRVRNGVQAGLYEVIPINPAMEEVFEQEAAKMVTNPAERCLLTLLRFDLNEGDVVWLDDRALSAYLHRDKAPIIGINEVLKALVAKGTLSQNDYYQKLHQLRAANVRFIPIQTDEICHHLLHARTENGVVIETPELRTLRRYMAACILQGDIIQRPPMSDDAPNATGEIMFILGVSRAISNAFREIWIQYEGDEAACYARSEWLISNLYLDMGAMQRMVFTERDQNDPYMMAVSFADLLSMGFQFASPVNMQRVRKGYFEWLYNRFLHNRFDSDPTILAITANILKTTFLKLKEDIVEDLPDENLRQSAGGLLGLFYHELPPILKEEMDKDDNFTMALGLDYTTVVNVGDLIVDADEFFRGAAAAINGETTIVPVLEPSTEIEFSPQQELPNRQGVQFSHPETEQIIRINNDELMLLSESVSERESVLRRNRHWFDCKHDDFERAVAEIASAEDARWRVETARAWRESSVAVLYQQLESKIEANRQFDLPDILPVIPNGLLRYLRLSSNAVNDSFHQSFSRAAEDLVATEGLLASLVRLTGLPVPLPEFFIDALATLPVHEKRSLIKEFLKHAQSPIAKIHAIYLLNRTGDNVPAFNRLARCIATFLLGESGQEEFKAFITVAQWVNEELGRRPISREWPTAMRLAVTWCHAHRLQSIFVSKRAPSAWIQKFFGDLTQQRVSSEVFESETEYWIDIAHPLRLKWLPFALTGLAYGFISDRSSISDVLRDRIAQVTCTETEGIVLPALDLITDSTLAGNATTSFLGTDHAEAFGTLLGDEAAQWFRSVKSQLAAKQFDNVRTLDAMGWVYLGSLLGGLVPPPEWKDLIEQSAEQADFVGMIEQDLSLGSIALLVSAQQSRHFDQPLLVERLEDQLLRATQMLAARQDLNRKYAEGSSTEENNLLLLRLVEVALRLAIANRDHVDTAVVFSSLLERMAKILPALLEATATIIQRLYQELPIAQAKSLTRLYLLLRATK